MNSEANSIPDALIALAGFFAERGVPRLVLEDATGTRLLESRFTDLPAELARAITGGSATVQAESIGVEVRFRGQSVSWDCAGTADAIAIAKLFTPT